MHLEIRHALFSGQQGVVEYTESSLAFHRKYQTWSITGAPQTDPDIRSQFPLIGCQTVIWDPNQRTLVWLDNSEESHCYIRDDRDGQVNHLNKVVSHSNRTGQP